MTSKKKKEILAWLLEREKIYKKYEVELGAFQILSNPSIWIVNEDGEHKLLTNSRLMNTDSARALIANHAYYCGAVDALKGFGLI